MSYKVDPTNLLFTDLDAYEAELLKEEVSDLVLNGTSVWKTKAFSHWLTAGGFDERQALLVMTTVYPAKALLSLVRMKDALTTARTTLLKRDLKGGA